MFYRCAGFNPLHDTPSKAALYYAEKLVVDGVNKANTGEDEIVLKLHRVVLLTMDRKIDHIVYESEQTPTLDGDSELGVTPWEYVIDEDRLRYSATFSRLRNEKHGYEKDVKYRRLVLGKKPGNRADLVGHMNILKSEAQISQYVALVEFIKN